jgi:uncharacterized protein YqeY
MIYAIMAKLLKQRKESIKSYLDGGRSDLAETEQMECDVISSYLPMQLSTEQVDRLVCDAIVKLGATTVKDMGKVPQELVARLAFSLFSLIDDSSLPVVYSYHTGHGRSKAASGRQGGY